MTMRRVEACKSERRVRRLVPRASAPTPQRRTITGQARLSRSGLLVLLGMAVPDSSSVHVRYGLGGGPRCHKTAES
ncbi:hypothetical protein LZ32DRAFT_605004 [Colletotrichum eremochloae]|nr:hypothetical protein LZ32DRAFT_605004 [Colletotrichum eremochloae]